MRKFPRHLIMRDSASRPHIAKEEEVEEEEDSSIAHFQRVEKLGLNSFCCCLLPLCRASDRASERAEQTGMCKSKVGHLPRERKRERMRGKVAKMNFWRKPYLFWRLRVLLARRFTWGGKNVQNYTITGLTTKRTEITNDYVEWFYRNETII